MSLIMPAFVQDMSTRLARVTGLTLRLLLPRPTVAPVVVDRPAAVESQPTGIEIEQAARAYFHAADTARRADREKRAARKLLDSVLPGTYGTWRLERVPSSRQVADLEEIRRIFKAHNLGPVPMKPSGASLKVTVAEPQAVSA